MPDRIPITVAERIGKEHGYDQVIINARRANADDTAVTLEWVTTWGKNKLHCDIAARIGNAIRDNVAPTIDRLNDALTRETARAEAAEARAAAMEAALEEISGHAPVKTPPDYATSSDTGEAFDDGYSRGVWEMGQIADAALAPQAEAGEPG